MAVTLLMALAADTFAEADQPTAAGAVADDVLPLGFLEYLGGMVEVQGRDQPTLLDPLAFEELVEPAEPEVPPQPLPWDEPAAGSRDDREVRP